MFFSLNAYFSKSIYKTILLVIFSFWYLYIWLFFKLKIYFSVFSFLQHLLLNSQMAVLQHFFYKLTHSSPDCYNLEIRSPRLPMSHLKLRNSLVPVISSAGHGRRKKSSTLLTHLGDIDLSKIKWMLLLLSMAFTILN